MPFFNKRLQREWEDYFVLDFIKFPDEIINDLMFSQRILCTEIEIFYPSNTLNQNRIHSLNYWPPLDLDSRAWFTLPSAVV